MVRTRQWLPFRFAAAPHTSKPSPANAVQPQIIAWIANVAQTRQSKLVPWNPEIHLFQKTVWILHFKSGELNSGLQFFAFQICISIERDQELHYLVWVQCSSFSTGLHDHTYHMIYVPPFPSFQQMFKRKRFLVEIDSDFLFKKVRKYVNVNIYVHLEFFDQPTNPENETCVSYYCFFCKIPVVSDWCFWNNAHKLRLSLFACNNPHCNISPSNSPTHWCSLKFDQIQAFPEVQPKPDNVGANTAFQILFFMKVNKLVLL